MVSTVDNILVGTNDSMKRTVIIGNGFDLATGSKTSFKDYLASPYFAGLNDNSSLKTYFKQRLEEDVYWCDLEAALPEWIDWLLSDPMTKDEAEFRRTGSINRITDFREMRDSVFNFVQQQEIDRFEPDKFRDIKEIVAAWLQTEDCDIFNFNYTYTFERFCQMVTAMKSIPNRSNHLYMHGTLENKNIVFGSADFNVHPEFLFVQKSNTPGYGPPKFSDIARESDEIDIFGHSLGFSDHAYFAAIFNSILRDSDVNPIVRIFTRDSDSEELIRGRISQITGKGLSEFYVNGKNLRLIPLTEMSPRERLEMIEREYGIEI